MLSKLIKHEFRATGRIMLLIYAAVAVLTILANLSFRVLNVTDNTLLGLIFGMFIALFFIGLVAAMVVTAVMMVLRFARSLLGSEGYLMHTLPVTVHHHIWAKLIVSLVWFIATFLLVWIVILLTVLIQSGTDLGALFAELPTLSQIREALIEVGISPGAITGMWLKVGAIGLLSCLCLCLHFYAAMSLGHMFSKNKILMSIVFFIALDIVFRILGTGSMMVNIRLDMDDLNAMETFSSALPFINRTFGLALVIQLVQGALLYIATALGLKKGLNLA